MPEDQMNTEADWGLKAMVAIAASDGRLDTREVGLIQQIYEKQTGRRLTATDIAGAAKANAEGDDVLAQFAAASTVLDKAAKEEIIRSAYLVLLADNKISGEERKKLKDIALALDIQEIHFGTILENLALSLEGDKG